MLEPKLVLISPQERGESGKKNTFSALSVRLALSLTVIQSYSSSHRPRGFAGGPNEIASGFDLTVVRSGHRVDANALQFCSVSAFSCIYGYEGQWKELEPWIA
jgi:hypothetical protein